MVEISNYMLTRGERLIENGYSILPIIPNQKVPERYTGGAWYPYTDWSRHCDRATTQIEHEIWKQWPGCAVGLACGAVVGIDIDVTDGAVAIQLENLAREMLGNTDAMRIGQEPKRALYYRAAVPFAGRKMHPVEVYGRGQQMVIYAIHPGTNCPYYWGDEGLYELDISRLPEITEAQAMAWLAAAYALVPEELRPKSILRDTGEVSNWSGPSDPVGTYEAVKSALAFIPNADLDGSSWVAMLNAVKAALGEKGRELWLDWSKSSAKSGASGKSDTAEKRWASAKPHSIGAGTLYYLAEQRGWVPDANLTLNGAAAERAGTAHPMAELLANGDTVYTRQESQPPRQPQTIATAVPMPCQFPGRVIDPWNTLEPPAFPHEALPPVLRSFVMERAHVIGADPCALAWSAMSACSAALHGGIRLQIKRHDRWAVPPAIWVCLVGSSSTKKTPIINAAWWPIDDAQKPAFREYERAQKAWRELTKKERDDTPPPEHPTRFTTHDCTIEALQQLLSRQDRGIGLIRDELAGFIGSMDKYSGGGNGGAVDRAFYLQSYNGGSFIVDRVMRGTTCIDNLLITLIGGIQPDRLATFSDLADDGLWQRFVPIIVSPATRGSDQWEGPEVDAYRSMIGRLLAEGEARLNLSDGARAVWHRIEGELFELERSNALGGKFASFCGKLPGLFGRLALVLSYVAGEGHDSAGHAVSQRTAEAARMLILHSAVPHAARVYTTMAGGGGDLDTTQAIAGYVLTKAPKRLLVSDLTSNVRPCRHKTLADVQRQVSPLVAGGWLEPVKPHAGNNAWTVNPVVHTTYADRAQTEGIRRQAARRLILGRGGGDDDDL